MRYADGTRIADLERMETEGRREQLKSGSQIEFVDYYNAIEISSDLRDRFTTIAGDFDIFITPVATGEAPAGLNDTGDSAFIFIWTALHVPCTTILAGTGPIGLPLGLQIVGKRGEDRNVLIWSQWITSKLS